MVDSVFVYAAPATTVVTGGTAVTAMFAPLISGFITNPASAEDQGVDPPEYLYVDFVRTATVGLSATTRALAPGETVIVPPNDTIGVSVNAATSGHRFSAVVVQPPIPFPPNPVPGTFPPAGPTAITKTTPSYLYMEYNDDEDLQAFVDAYNEIMQAYVDWFNGLNLPNYTQDPVSGALLDWVAAGLYGITRPSLQSGNTNNVGPFNTYTPNAPFPVNDFFIEGDTEFHATTDDDFRRIITWHFFKGDGRVFNVRWLKRRITRFLNGADGKSYNVDQTYDVSVTFGSGNDVHITVGPYAPVLQEAIESGVLELPFQYNFIVMTG